MDIRKLRDIRCKENTSVFFKGETFDIPLTELVLSHHILMLGSVGSGKTAAVMGVLDDIIFSMAIGDIVVVFDQNDEYKTKYYQPERDVIISSDDCKDINDRFTQIVNDNNSESGKIIFVKSSELYPVVFNQLLKEAQLKERRESRFYVVIDEYVLPNLPNLSLAINYGFGENPGLRFIVALQGVNQENEFFFGNEFFKFLSSFGSLVAFRIIDPETFEFIQRGYLSEYPDVIKECRNFHVGQALVLIKDYGYEPIEYKFKKFVK